ncbi:MAG: TIGR02597 family protein [Verrucomicrobiota bacterium]
MKIPLKHVSLLAGAVTAIISSLGAVETVPVGYISKDVNPNADLRLGIPFKQGATFRSAVDTVNAGVIGVAASVPDVTTDAHYLLVTNGPLVGNWFQVTDSSDSSITVAVDLENEGLLTGNTFEVIPFWTLDSLFPSGGDIPQSSDVLNPVAFILLNDVSQTGTNLAATGGTFVFHSGEQVAAGWYDTSGDFSSTAGSQILSPETYITIRNETGSIVSVTVAGTVPDTTIANDIVSRLAGNQDNQIVNPFPAGVTLSTSELFEDGVIRASSDVLNPLDLLFVFEGSPDGKNPTASLTAIYHDGAQVAEGWYDLSGDFSSTIDSYELPLGGALIVRRVAGADGLITWTPALPYSLD